MSCTSIAVLIARPPCRSSTRPPTARHRSRSCSVSLELLGNEARAIQQPRLAVTQTPEQCHPFATDEGDAGQIEAQPCPAGQDRLAHPVQFLDPRADKLSLEIQRCRLRRAFLHHDLEHLAGSPCPSRWQGACRHRALPRTARKAAKGCECPSP